MNLVPFYDWLQSLKVSQQLKLFTGRGRNRTPREGQGIIPFCLGHHFWPVRHGRLYQQLRYRRHSSQDHMTTQAPPLRQSRNTYGGLSYILRWQSKNVTKCWLFDEDNNYWSKLNWNNVISYLLRQSYECNSVYQYYITTGAPHPVSVLWDGYRSLLDWVPAKAWGFCSWHIAPALLEKNICHGCSLD
jgi:hypothetical protein